MKTLEQIAAELQGYDPQALRAADVNQFLARLVEPVTAVEDVAIFAALDRVLARDVISPISVPPHDNSAMDGFAFDGAQLRTGEALALRIVGTALAGKAWQGSVGPGECVKIMTGAIMPAGLDTVVPQEFTRVEGETVRIPPNVLQRGDNRRLLGEGAAFLVGIDLVKAETTLVAAYDDAQGVTADFNLNLLARINRELGGDFDLAAFAHRAVWNAGESRIEMHLESLRDQTVHVRGQPFQFRKGETLHTENSHKFTLEGFAALSAEAGWTMEQRWISPDPAFAIVLLRA